MSCLQALLSPHAELPWASWQERCDSSQQSGQPKRHRAHWMMLKGFRPCEAGAWRGSSLCARISPPASFQPAVSGTLPTHRQPSPQRLEGDLPPSNRTEEKGEERKKK